MKKLLYFIPFCFTVVSFAMQENHRFERTDYNNGTYTIFDKIFPEVSFTLRAGKEGDSCYLEACLGGYHLMLMQGEDAKNMWEIYRDDFYEQEKNKPNPNIECDVPALESDNDDDEVVRH
jgi:hypothetical protein